MSLEKKYLYKISYKNVEKPNVALQKPVKSTNKKHIYAYIYREKYNLQVYSTILMREGCVKNLSKIKYHLVRGKQDLNALERRKTSRSKYEAKNLRKYL